MCNKKYLSVVLGWRDPIEPLVPKKAHWNLGGPTKIIRDLKGHKRPNVTWKNLYFESLVGAKEDRKEEAMKTYVFLSFTTLSVPIWAYFAKAAQLDIHLYNKESQ